MKRQNIFLGVLLIGFGLFYMLKQFHIHLLADFYSWPSLLVILGLAFTLQALVGKDDSTLFPGILLLGLGIHFHARVFVATWPDSWAMYTLIISVAFLIRYQTTKKDGLGAGIILLLISILGFMYDAYQEWLNSITSFVEAFWPIALVVVGAYLLFKKR